MVVVVLVLVLGLVIIVYYTQCTVQQCNIYLLAKGGEIDFFYSLSYTYIIVFLYFRHSMNIINLSYVFSLSLQIFFFLLMHFYLNFSCIFLYRYFFRTFF